MKCLRMFSQDMAQRGDMLVELLMSVALAALVLPFLFRYQQDAVYRAENVAYVRQMENVQTALERYIVDNRSDLLKTVGRNIVRVNISDLADYGINENIIAENGDKYQLRVLKSSDATGQATLQGVIVMTDQDISPLRTREIIALGGGNMGFIEGTHAYGSFGVWRADTIDLGLGQTDGIVGTTGVRRDNALYLWRVPSTNADDATMMSALNLGGHDITNAKFFDAASASFGETLHVGRLVSDKVIFQNRTTIDSKFSAQSAVCAGILSADARSMEIANTFTMSDLGKFSNFTTGDLWVNNLTLGGLSISDTTKAAILKINQALDMTGGRIDAIFATVSFTGSITPRLVVKDRIEDSIDPEFFWDVKYNTAHMSDMALTTLTDMAPYAVARETDRRTESGQLFSAVAANKNATAADYMNAIVEIQNRVRAKYRLLNLE